MGNLVPGPDGGQRVYTFNGRDGIVVPITGDYTAAQVTHAADLSDTGTQTFSGPIVVGGSSTSGPAMAGGNGGHIDTNTGQIRLYSTEASVSLYIDAPAGVEFGGSFATSPPLTVVTPSIAASGTAVTNITDDDCMVYVQAASSTVTVAVMGTTVGIIPAGGLCGFYVANGSTIALTYTTAPTWTFQAV